MNNKIKNIIIILEFVLILFIILFVNLIKEDNKISITERRKLAQFPIITISSVLSGESSKELDKYVTDQFWKRDSFRNIKYWFNMNILKQQDNNNMFVKNGCIYKMEYPLNENLVEKSAQKIQSVNEKYLNGMNVYYSIIPDKNYYLKDNHLKLDYLKIEKIMNQNLKNASYINIKDTLTINDFYKTDLHWKNENIVKVAKRLKEGMNNKTEEIIYTEKIIGDFYGTYYAQVPTQVKPDTIKYLSNNMIENCVTFNYEINQYNKVYDLEKYSTSTDKYDIFLSGPTSLITIENKECNNNKELILFRDSFGSSIAPLMIDGYNKIILVDLRYMSDKLLEEYIEFKNQDVLFLYSGTVLQAGVFK